MTEIQTIQLFDCFVTYIARTSVRAMRINASLLALTANASAFILITGGLSKATQLKNMYM